MAALTGSAPGIVELGSMPWAAESRDIDSRLGTLDGVRWAVVRYAPGAQRDDWCTDGHRGYVLCGHISYELDGGENAKRPDSLLSDLAHNQPRLRNRARAVRLQYEKVCDTIVSLRRELDQQRDAAVDYADVRQRLGWVLTALRHQRARESDLIYEAYYEAFNEELRLPGSEMR
jgi:hypothetical protein